MSLSMNRLARFVWNRLPEGVRGWLRAVRAGDPKTPGAAFAHRVLQRVVPKRIRQALMGGPANDRPTLVERFLTSPYVSYRLLKRADTQRALRRTTYQRYLDGYSTYELLGLPSAIGTPDVGSFVKTVLLDPTLRDAFGYQDLASIVALTDERAAMQLASRPERLEEILFDPVVLAAFHRPALKEGPDTYATRIAQEIGGRADYRRCIFDRLGQGGNLTLVRCGNSTVIASLSDYGVAKELFSTQEFELDVFQRYLSLRKDRALKCFIDVGANLGTHTLYALREAGFERAIAVEPDPRNLRLLRANLALNDADGKATVLPVAVAEAQGSIDLFQSAINWGDNRTSPVNEEGWTSLKVATKPLDQIVRDADFDPAGLTIWIDVQGAEFGVLKGASETLVSDADLVIEFWPHELGRTGQLENMVGMLETLDRRLVRLDDETSLDGASVAKLAQDLLRQGPAGFIDIALLPASSR